ncbi:MAG: hypothetical protein IKY64_07765 [Bacteroidaceae bacterium]|nr:hypothetical protein [Bacteroidaceae bacterium]
MKKIIINMFIAVIAIASTISCTNDPVEIQKQVQITISPSKVLKDIVPFYNSSDIEMLQIDGNVAKLKLVVLIYDKNGDLYHQSEKTVKDYNSNYTFSVLVNDDDYRLLAFSYSVLDRDGESLSAYSITNTDKLNSLKIRQESSNSLYSNFSVLGMYDKKVSICDNMHVDLSMATSYVSFEWLNIHSDSNTSTGSSSIYGEYSATATDYFGNDYSWTISVEQDFSRTNGVIVKDLCPLIYDAGFTSEDGYNTYYGYIEDNFLVIEAGQETGAASSGEDITIEGLFVYDGETYESDIMFYIEGETLILATYFGSWNSGGWFSLFEPGLVFDYVGGGYSGVDSYTYWRKCNNILTFTNSGYEYSTTLGIDTYRVDASIEPAENPDANGIYKIYNLFPGTFEVFMKESVGNESEEYCRQQITIESGKQYNLEYNCETKEMKLLSNSRTRSTTNKIVHRINKPFKPYYKKELKPISKYPLFCK